MIALTAWLLTFALHTFALLTIAFAIDKLCHGMRNTWRELLWKSALFGALLTATAQVALQSVPFAGLPAIMREAPHAVVALPAAETLPIRSEPRMREAQTAIQSTAGVPSA